MDLLFLHGSGLGWDEALIALGGLVALTGALAVSLRGRAPAPDEVRPAEARQAARSAKRRQR